MPSSRLAFTIRPIAAAVLSLAAAFSHAAPLSVDLPAQSLTTSIQQLSRQSGLSIGGDSSLLEGKTAPAVKGNLEATDALRKLLEGSGLSVSFEGNKAVIGKSATVLKEVAVVSDAVAAPKEGSAEVGYKPTTAKTTGPWGDKQILDTPYSINSTSAELIENMLSGSTDNAIKFNPIIQQTFSSYNNGNIMGYIRGFAVSEVTRDGVPIRYSWLSSIIDNVDRFEVLSGLSGFLYGPGNVGGLVNQVTKRPTADRIANVTVGNYGGEQYYVHADLGGPIDSDGKFGYRLNIATTDGDTSIKNQSIRKNFVGGALDWHVMDNLIVQFDASYAKEHVSGYSGVLQLWGLEKLPSARDFDNKKSFAPSWGNWDLESKKIGAAMKWDLNDTLALRGAYLFNEETRVWKYGTPWVQADGSVWLGYGNTAPLTPKNDGGYLYIDKVFETGPLKHKVTVGGNFSSYKLYQHIDGSSYREVFFPSLDSALNAPEINWPVVGAMPTYLAEKINYLTVMVGDDIKINDQWSVLVGLSRSSIDSDAYNSTGLMTGGYSKSASSPSVSIIFKPVPNLSTYLTYLEALEAGPIVSTTAIPAYTNAGSVLAPTISKQIEFGTKAVLGNTLFTAAIFEIDKANSYDQFNSDGTRTLNQDGRQVHRGLELTAAGKITDRLTVFGGGTFIDAEITKTNSAIDEGKTPAGVAKRKISSYLEYRVPSVEGLYVTGGISHVGKSEYKSASPGTRNELPGFTIGDIGLRYETKALGNSLIGRLYVSNVTNEKYWVNTGAPSMLGSPRTIGFSATMKF